MDKKEKIVVIISLVVLVAALIYVISSAGKPSGVIDNLITGGNQNHDQRNGLTIEPLPGDEDLVIKDLIVGTGKEAMVGDKVLVNYEGFLEDGTKFDSSYDRGQLFEVTIGYSNVIRGWHLGLLGMKESGKRELIIPPHLAYGSETVGPIPPSSTLKFVIELVSVEGSVDDQILNF